MPRLIWEGPVLSSLAHITILSKKRLTWDPEYRNMLKSRLSPYQSTKVCFVDKQKKQLNKMGFLNYSIYGICCG